MGSDLQDEYDYLFEDEDPQAIIEVQRRHQEDSESDKDEEPGSEDELTEDIVAELEAAYDEDNDVEDFGAQYHHVHSQSTAFAAHSSPTLPSATAPPPEKLTVSINGAPAQDDRDDSDQEFEAISLHTHTATVLAIASPETPAKTGRRRRPKKEPQTVNLDGLPICLDDNGIKIGYKEAPPAENTYAWASDTAITENDPYHAKGCERRMIFESNPVPVNQKYRTHEQRFVKKTGEVEFPSAVDKAYEWNRTRKGVTGATDETLKDGKILKHFLLKMGPPNGPNGDTLRVAERLKALVEHFFYGRLARSHLTIEIEIPFHRPAGQSYYEKYMEKVREVMENKKIRDRLTVQLAPETAQKYLDCDPNSFYPPNVNHEAIWQNKITDFKLVWTLVFPGDTDPMPSGWVASWGAIDTAKQRWLHSQKVTEAERKGHIDRAIAEVQDFVQFVRHYETWKEDGSIPQTHTMAVVTPSPALQQSPNRYGPNVPVVVDKQNALEVLQGVQLQPAVPAPYAPSPRRAPAPLSSLAPRPPTSSPHTLCQAPIPPPRPLESFKQPDPVTFLRYGARDDQYSSIMSFGSTLEQQSRNINEMTQHQTRQYHRGVQQTSMQTYQQLRQQQQGSPAAPVAASAASPALLSSSELIARSGVTGVGSPTTPSLGKRNDDAKEDEHVGKRSRK